MDPSFLDVHIASSSKSVRHDAGLSDGDVLMVQDVEIIVPGRTLGDGLMDGIDFPQELIDGDVALIHGHLLMPVAARENLIVDAPLVGAGVIVYVAPRLGVHEMVNPILPVHLLQPVKLLNLVLTPEDDVHPA